MPDDLSDFKFKKRYGTGHGKPAFPDETDTYDIADYIGPDSVGFFVILKLDPSFLQRPAEQWKDLESYKHAERVVKGLKVVNDAAERGVQLTADFLNSAKSEDRFQQVLQVVENDRKIIPNQRKRHARIMN